MLNELLQLMGNRTEYVVFKRGNQERRVRREDNAWLYYDIWWDKREITFYRYGLSYEIARLALKEAESTPPCAWRRKNAKKIYKRIFLNDSKPRLFHSLRLIKGGKFNQGCQSFERPLRVVDPDFRGLDCGPANNEGSITKKPGGEPGF